MRKFLSMIITIATLLSVVSTAEARDRRYRHRGDDAAAGIILGLAAGLIIGRALNDDEPQYRPRRHHHLPTQPIVDEYGEDYTVVPSPPPGWVFRLPFERQGGHCGRIGRWHGEPICRPE